MFRGRVLFIVHKTQQTQTQTHTSERSRAREESETLFVYIKAKMTIDDDDDGCTVASRCGSNGALCEHFSPSCFSRLLMAMIAHVEACLPAHLTFHFIPYFSFVLVLSFTFFFCLLRTFASQPLDRLTSLPGVSDESELVAILMGRKNSFSSKSSEG